MTIWFISDTHFGHANLVTTFTREDGSPVRAFSSVQEMDEIMIARWNAVVRPTDHVYHLGDVAMRKDVLDRVMPRLPGHLRLVRGNHDIFKTRIYLRYFEEIVGMRVFDRLLFSHIPVHPESLGRFAANIHGHTHHRCLPAVTKYHRVNGVEDQARPYTVPYLNICVERTDYRPVSLEEIRSWI